MLNQRAANMPEAAPRKRRTPVLEADGSERDILSEKNINQEGKKVYIVKHYRGKTIGHTHTPRHLFFSYVYIFLKTKWCITHLSYYSIL